MIASRTAFVDGIEDLKRRLDEHKRAVLAEADRALDGRVKAMDARCDEVAVSISQLAAVVSMCKVRALGCCNSTPE